jgi:hypothetical protein
VPPVGIAAPRGRPSWALSGFDFFRSQLSGVPQGQNLLLYESLRELLPVLNAAIVKTTQFVGCPTIDAADETKAEIEDWLARLPVNRVQSGWVNWLSTWLDNALLYGRAHTEIILNAARDDIFALVELHPRTIQFRPARDRYSCDVVQYQFGSASPVKLNPLLTLNAVHELRGDNPNGTSLLWGMPFIAEILTTLIKALGGMWDRFGVPTFHVNWDTPDDFDDPTGSRAGEIIDDITARFNTAMQSRAEKDLRDFFSTGKVTVSVVGAAGEQLDFQTPMRTLEEQVVAATHIPPFVFGFQWATTERMSATQASLLTQMITALRAEITSEIEYLIDLRQRLTGGDREWQLCWPAPTLIDHLDTARGDLFAAQARETEIKNAQALWRLGANTRLDFARQVRPDLAKLDDAALVARLPELAREAPAMALPEPAAARPDDGGNNPFMRDWHPALPANGRQ